MKLLTTPSSGFMFFTRFAMLLLSVGSIIPPSQAQQTTLHEFVTEYGSTYDNGLQTDGTFFYGTLYNGNLKSNGSIYRIKVDGSGYEVLYSFADEKKGTLPIGSLVLSGTTLYGMTLTGGVKNDGVIYKIQTDGTGFQKLLDFNGDNGTLPYASLTISGTVLYGVCQQGGGLGFHGLIFKLNTDGTGYQSLLKFDGENGAAPTGSLLLSESVMYGVTRGGGVNGLGVVYSINTDGSGYKTLFSFDNTNGSSPDGSLVLSGNTLYGTASSGGSKDWGTVFKIDTDGNNFGLLHNFNAPTDGIDPHGKLTLIGSSLYGMTNAGGTGGNGLIYKINLDGSNFQVLSRFDGTNGYYPYGYLLSFNDLLYAHVPGGIHGYGVIFKIKPDGTEFENLHEFTATNSGYMPNSPILFSATSGYGITQSGGEFNGGTIYKINPDGSDYEVIYNFEGLNGKYPRSLTLSGETLYGTTQQGGGPLGYGVLFKIGTNGSDYEVLSSISYSGLTMVGSLVDGGNVLYGMTSSGGVNNTGVIFEFNKDTKVFSNIFEFSDTDAKNPRGSLVLSGSKLYGMSDGGIGDGIVFSINTDGSDFKKLLDISAEQGGQYGNSITITGSTIYGTTSEGGQFDSGIIFKLNTDGTGFQKLFDFDFTHGDSPVGATIESNGIIYGMTQFGGTHNTGVAYKMKVDGKEFKVLFEFEETFNSTTNGGATSQGSLSLFDNYLYGAISSYSGTQRNENIIRYDLNYVAPIDEVTAIDDVEAENSQLYPNPTTGLITINQLGKKDEQVFILDTFGQRQNIRVIDSNKIDVSHLPAGFYYLIIDSKANKFIKI